jgi:hypothetical protein
MNAKVVLASVRRYRQARRKMFTAAALTAWLLSAAPATAAHFDGPFHFWNSVVFYVVNPTDQAFTIEVKGQSAAARPMLIRVFDPNERRLARKNLPENDSLDTQMRPFRFTCQARGKGVHQVHILGESSSVDFRTQPALPFGVFGHSPCLRTAGMQFHRAYIYLPPKLPSLHVFAGGIGKVERLTLSDGTGKSRLSLGGKGQKDLKGDVPLPESGEHIWKLSVEANPREKYHLAFGNAPIILCPDPETARAIHASTDVMPDGTLCFHKCQVRAWQLLQKYRQMPASAFEAPLPDLEKYKAEWLKDPVRNRILLDHVYTKLAYALKDQNLDPKSPWFGTLGVWHDNTGAEYPGNPFGEYSRRDMEQAGMLAVPLACVYAINEPFNPLYRNEALRRRVLIASLQDIMLMKESESVDVGTGFHFGGQAMYFNKLTAPFAYVARDCPRDEYNVWSEGMARMSEHLAVARITNVNQWTWLIASFARMSLGSDDPWYRGQASRHARWIANRSPGYGQMPAGYHWEGQGPDATYEGHSLASLAVGYRITGDPLMLEMARRSYELFDHTVAPEPDGKLLGASSFAARTPGDWNLVQGDSGFSTLGDILPQAGRQAGVRYSKPPATEEELREAAAKLSAETRFFGYLPHNFRRNFDGFGVAGEFELYRYHCRKPLSGQVPAVSAKPFVKAFGDEFYFVRRPAYYAAFYAGHHKVPGNRSPLKQGEHTGGLMLFWSPGFGTSVRGMNWNAYSANSLLATASDGNTSREDHPSVRAVLKQNPDRLLITGQLYNLPIQFSREYEFLNDRLGVTLTLKATAPVRLASFVECFPYPSPQTKSKPDPITVQTPDGNILDANARDTASVALRNNSSECHWLVFAEKRRCQAATTESLTHYEDRVRAGSLQVAIPVDWTAGQQRVFRYALGPGAAPAAKPAPSQKSAIVATAPTVPTVAQPATKAPAALPAAKLALRPVAPDKDGFINLLPLVDPQQDAVRGRWEPTADGLVLSGVPEAGMLDLPYAPPEEYDFEIEFTPRGGSNSINQYLAAAGRSFVWRVDGYDKRPPIFCFEYLDGKTAMERSEAVVRKPQPIPNGQRYTSKVEVRRGSLRALVNGEEFLRWSGDFNRLSMPPHFNLKDYRHLGVGSWKRGVIFHRIAVREVTGKGLFGHATAIVAPPAPATATPAVSTHTTPPVVQPVAKLAPTPIAPAKPGTINLLPLIDPEKDAVEGKWELVDGELIGDKHNEARLEIPYRPPEEYDFTIAFTIKSSTGGAVGQSLAKAGHEFVWIGFAFGNRFGFDLVNGSPLHNNPTRTDQDRWKRDVQYVSEVQIRNGSVRGCLDGKLLSEWKTDYSDMSLRDKWKLRTPGVLGVSCQTRVIFHRIEVREVTGKGTLTRSTTENAQPAPAPQPANAAAVNLLALVDPRRDVVQGIWKLAADGITLEKPDAAGVLDLPYAPPEEYDFEIEFTPSVGNNSVNQFLVAAGRSFAWKLNAYGEKPPLYCVDLLDGKSAEYRDEASAQKPLTLEAGKRCTSKLEVRRGSLRALVNGEEYLRWSGDFARLSLESHYKLHDNRHLGVGSFQRGATFHRIEVREVSGKGQLARPAP